MTSTPATQPPAPTDGTTAVPKVSADSTPPLVPPPPPTQAEREKAEKDKRELLDWAETRGLEYLKEHMANVESLKTDSTQLLTVLMAAGAAVLAYIIKAPEKHVAGEMVGGAIVLLVYLFVLGSLLIAKCIAAKEAPAINNSASNLYCKGAYSLAHQKEYVFEHMQKSGKKLRARNEATARWLNGLRYAALLSPVAFSLGYAAVAAVNHWHVLALLGLT